MASNIHDIDIRRFNITPENSLEIELGAENLDCHEKGLVRRLQNNTRMALGAIDAIRAMLVSPEDSGPFYDTYKHLGRLIIKDYESIDELMSGPAVWLEKVREAMHEEIDRDFQKIIQIAGQFSNEAAGGCPSGEFVTPDSEAPEVTHVS